MTWLLLLLAVLIGAGWLVRWWLFQMALPKVGGKLRAPGLQAGIEVIRDQFGVPHIYAQSLDDALFGLGYVHAQDRLWQMELQRRVGAGRLSEIFGPAALEADRFLRRIGLRRAAESEAAHMDADEERSMQAYCRGVNTAIEAMGRRLPLEFRLLGIKPAPWTPADGFAWAKMMALSLIHNWEDELLRYKLVQKVGPEMAARLESRYLEGQPLTADPAAIPTAAVIDEVLQLFEAAKPFLMTPAGASNNWAIAGERTATGKPLVANDPHLTVNLPLVWYEAHLICTETDMTGVTLPGLPIIIIGHNRHVGWGITDAFVDAADLFMEKWHTTDPKYEFQGQWQDADVVTEVIRVKGKPDVTETVYVTRHGPLLGGGPLGDGPALALQWAALEPGHTLRSGLRMMQSRNGQELIAALADWTAPSLNVVYADTDGNIGAVVAGRAPIRREGSGLTPVPGWTGEYDWQGWVPPAEMPQVHNPDVGFVATANNRVVDRTFGHHISWDYMPGFRAERIISRLNEIGRATAADCARLQSDVYCIPGARFAQFCRNLSPADPLERRALEALLEWDGHLTPTTVGGTVYEVMQHHATKRAYGPILGEELLENWLGKGMTALSAANLRAGRAYVALLRDLEAQAPLPEGAGYNSWDALLAASLTDAVQFLRTALGDDISLWQWGSLHKMKIAHPLSAAKPLNLIFRGAELPVGGDFNTPMQTAYVPHRPFGASAWAPSCRVIFDFADPDQSLSILPAGQSGHPGSPHYLDQLPLWHRGEYHPMPFSRQAVQLHAKSALRLEP